MIYQALTSDDPLDQGDVIDGCPVATVTAFQTGQLDTARSTSTYSGSSS